jgi:hypothetical protein
MVAKSHCRLGVVVLIIVAREQTEKLDVDTDELIAIDFGTPPLKETLLLSCKKPPLCPTRQLSRHVACVDVPAFVVDCQRCLMYIVHCFDEVEEEKREGKYSTQNLREIPTRNLCKNLCNFFGTFIFALIRDHFFWSEDGFLRKLHRNKNL